MENFTYHNPTRIHFGRGQISQIDREIPRDARVLLLAGTGSIRQNGVYDQVRRALGTRGVREFFGIEANPDYDTMMRAVELCRSEQIDWLLPVGGGSVIDGAKLVAVATKFAGDPWDIFTKKAKPQEALPIGTVLTLPGTGTEANGNCVISRRAIQEKRAFGNPLAFPRFSILDPETTLSLPPRQIANGTADAFAHVLEQYLTYPANAALQDRFAESVLGVLIDEGPKTLANLGDYDARANVMWAATWALNTAIGMGVPGDWASHVIGHELTALHQIDHARTLAIVMPSLIQVQRSTKKEKLLQYAARVWDLRVGSEETRIDAAISRTRTFFEGLGLKTRLSDYGVKIEVSGIVARRLEARGAVKLGERGDITPAVVEQILRLAA